MITQGVYQHGKQGEQGKLREFVEHSGNQGNLREFFFIPGKKNNLDIGFFTASDILKNLQKVGSCLLPAGA